MNDNWYRLNGKHTLALAREAMQARIVKYALDGKQDLKRELENALADINAALVEALPDRPSTSRSPLVRCFITLEELTDIQSCMQYGIAEMNRFKGISFAMTRDRYQRVLQNVTTAIKLNRPR